jgi:L-seryl-tRNA(Ser) seleniumtransferase
MGKETVHLHSLPSVDAVLKTEGMTRIASVHGRSLCVFAVRETLARERIVAREKDVMPDIDKIATLSASLATSLAVPSLIPVINATGVILHTNLGRAVLGEKVLSDISGIVRGYSNIEFNLTSGARGNRRDHIAALLRFCTGAQDALVVNNNAAAIVLALSTLAKKREVIVSRGELVEIGGEFRIPDIMAASGCRMVEVGTTNRTRIADYEKAITEKTSVIFKAHKSNYAMTGFVEEATLAQCALLAREKNIPFVYDLGSGMLRKPEGLPLGDEPDVRSAIAAGADLVLFSGDKLLGGPQAGIMAGNKDLVARCAKSPLMRALRVGKLTMAALASACLSYCDDASLVKNNPTFALLSRDSADIKRCAHLLLEKLEAHGVHAMVADTLGQCGGGTLPNVTIPSAAVIIEKSGPKRVDALRNVFDKLRTGAPPVVAVFREGRLVFDMLAVAESDIPVLAHAITTALEKTLP